MTFRVGQKVVCVDAASGDPARYFPCELIKGSIYTIQGFGEHSDHPGETGVHLCEIQNRWHQGHRESFNPARFRPLADRKSDIGFAHEILRKVSRKDRVSA